VVYLEQLTSALYLDKRRDVDRYSAVMDQLCVQAERRVPTTEVLAGSGPAGQGWPAGDQSRLDPGLVGAPMQLQICTWVPGVVENRCHRGTCRTAG
jgi:hypothetical protein